MIDQESRSKESSIMESLFFRNLRRKVNSADAQVQWFKKLQDGAKDLRAVFARINAVPELQSIDRDFIPQLEKDSEAFVIVRDELVAKANRSDYKGLPASQYKGKGQWMISLISSGAITAWMAHRYDSSAGNQIHVEKQELNEDGEADGMTFTADDLKGKYDDGSLMQRALQVPLWTTALGQYPTLVAAPDPHADQTISEDSSGPEAHIPQHQISPTMLVPNAFLAQHLRAERTILGNGQMSVKVFIMNMLANGQNENKEFRDDPGKVTEEVQRARISNQIVLEAISEASYEQQIRSMKDIVATHAEDDLD